MSPVVAVVGTIAGAGATTTATALGTALAEQRRRVALVDATAEGSRIADVLDVEDGGNLADALRRGTAVPDVQGSGPHDVAAFPAAPDTSWGSMRPDAVATLYDQLRERFDFVLVDCGSDLSPARSAWLGHADEVLVVTDPDVAGAVPETASLAGAFDVPVRGALANRVPPKEVGDAVDALGETDLPVLGVLPEDPTVGMAADAGDSVLRTEPDSMIATVAWELAVRFRRRDHDEPVVPFGTGPTPSAEPDGPTAEVDDPTPEADDQTPEADDPASGDREPTSGTDGTSSGDHQQEGASGTPSTATPEPAPPADDADASSEAANGTVDSQPADPAESTSPSGSAASETDPSDDRSDDGDSQEGGTVSPDEDPFTSPDPLAVEDDEAEPADAEGGASESEPSGSLLGDVRARIGDQRSDQRAAGPDTDGPAADAPDPAGDPSDPDPPPEGTDGDGDEPAASSPGQVDNDPDRESDPGGADDESAALSDEEIESLFAETMERVQERRDSEPEESADGTAREDGEE